MAWIRTVTAMISFAFTIYKLFQFARTNALAGRMRGIISPRDFAIVVMSIGLVSLLLATIGHHEEPKRLVTTASAVRHSLAAVAALVSLFGVAVLASAILRE